MEKVFLPDLKTMSKSARVYLEHFDDTQDNDFEALINLSLI